MYLSEATRSFGKKKRRIETKIFLQYLNKQKLRDGKINIIMKKKTL